MEVDWKTAACGSSRSKLSPLDLSNHKRPSQCLSLLAPKMRSIARISKPRGNQADENVGASRISVGTLPPAVVRLFYYIMHVADCSSSSNIGRPLKEYYRDKDTTQWRASFF